MHQREFSNQILNTQSFGVLEQVIKHLPYYAMLLDGQRKIVMTNDKVAIDSNALNFSDIINKKPGELFQCENAKEAGCGNSSFCSYCGIFKTINDCLSNGKPCKYDSKLLVNRGNKINAYEFTANCSPLFVDNNLYLLLTLLDIRAENRKQMLERIFFHDILNIINGQYGLVQIISEMNNQPDLFEYLDCLQKITENLVRNITDQRDLVSAENNELIVNTEEINSEQFVASILNNLKFIENSKLKNIRIGNKSHSFILKTDPVLFARILTNMIKNAIEADGTSPDITVSYYLAGDKACFAVHNLAYINNEASSKVFMPSFSTKGKYRGLGTYSMRLIGENYLKGRVRFTTHPQEGTTFTIDLPIN